MAESYLLKALQKEPDNFDFLYAICTIYLESNKKSEAAKYARKLIDKYPSSPEGNQLLEISLK